MSEADLRQLRELRAWAMRCADKVNQETPCRAPHLGTLLDFNLAYPHARVRTWEAAYSYILSQLPERERS